MELGEHFPKKKEIRPSNLVHKFILVHIHTFIWVFIFQKGKLNKYRKSKAFNTNKGKFLERTTSTAVISCKFRMMSGLTPDFNCGCRLPQVNISHGNRIRKCDIDPSVNGV